MHPRLLSKLLAGAILAVCLASEVHAADWTISPPESSITFKTTATGQPLEGRFEQFRGRIAFDPAPNPRGDVRIEIAIGSLRTGASDRDAQAQSSDWFDAGRKPDAVFPAEHFKRLGPDRYEADGPLVIKDATVPVALPFTFHADANGTATVEGQVSLDRLTFRLGQGQFADEAVVGHTVLVSIRIRAQQAK